MLLVARIIQTALGDIFGIVTATVQYIILLLGFVGFVIWNRGVVLGKSADILNTAANISRRQSEP
jgi:hypothetical protein